jgi:hypothetical protein
LLNTSATCLTGCDLPLLLSLAMLVRLRGLSSFRLRRLGLRSLALRSPTRLSVGLCRLVALQIALTPALTQLPALASCLALDVLGRGALTGCMLAPCLRTLRAMSVVSLLELGRLRALTGRVIASALGALSMVTLATLLDMRG